MPVCASLLAAGWQQPRAILLPDMVQEIGSLGDRNRYKPKATVASDDLDAISLRFLEGQSFRLVRYPAGHRHNPRLLGTGTC